MQAENILKDCVFVSVIITVVVFMATMMIWVIQEYKHDRKEK